MPSPRQLAYLHQQVFPALAAHWHETAPRARLIMLGARYGWKMSPATGHWLPVRASLTELSTPECAELIDWVIEWAQDRQVTLQQPLPWKEPDDDPDDHAVPI